MKKIIPKIWKFFLLWRDHISGDFAYRNYVEHQKKSHRNHQILNKKSFLRNKEKEKWQKINRCC